MHPPDSAPEWDDNKDKQAEERTLIGQNHCWRSLNIWSLLSTGSDHGCNTTQKVTEGCNSLITLHH